MSKIEFFSLEGLRIDGRRKDEVRNTKMFCGSDCSIDFLDYDGVSEVIHGLNKVQVMIKGPSEDFKSARNVYGILEEPIDMQIEIVISTEKKVKNSPNERLIKDLILSVKSTYQEMVISQCYRGCTVSLFINIIEYDGSIKSTVINAVGIALVDAGIALKDLVASCTVAHLDSVILTDPNQMEVNSSTALLCLAVSISTEKIVYMDYRSKVPLNSLNLMFESAISGSRKFTELARDMLKNYGKRAVAINRKIHSN